MPANRKLLIKHSETVWGVLVHILHYIFYLCCFLVPGLCYTTIVWSGLCSIPMVWSPWSVFYTHGLVIWSGLVWSVLYLYCIPYLFQSCSSRLKSGGGQLCINEIPTKPQSEINTLCREAIKQPWLNSGVDRNFQLLVNMQQPCLQPYSWVQDRLGEARFHLERMELRQHTQCTLIKATVFLAL